jgi:tRNA(Ile)-lysidine synthase
VRQFLNHHLPHRANFEQVDKLIGLIAAPHRSRCDPFPGGIWAEVDRNWIWLKTRDRQS